MYSKSLAHWGFLEKNTSEAFIFLFTGCREHTEGRCQALGPLEVMSYQNASAEETTCSLGISDAMALMMQ